MYQFLDNKNFSNILEKYLKIVFQKIIFCYIIMVKFSHRSTYMKYKIKKDDIFDLFMVLAGTIIMGFAFNIFLIPYNISMGGFSGLAAVISTLLGNANIHLNPSIIYLVLNIFLYVFAYKTLGKRFAIFALIGILAYSLSMELTALIKYTPQDDLLICSLYGGIIWGVGTGLIVRHNASTGGTDMLASIIRRKTTKLSTGTIILIADVVVLALNIIAYGVDSLLYSILVLFLATFITDMVIDGSRGVKAYYIITNKKDELTEKIFSEINRGATEIHTTGMYTHEQKSMILCLINKYRAPMLKKIVHDIDPQAFVFSTNVSEVIGNGFYIPTPKVKKKKKFNPTIKKESNLINNEVSSKETITESTNEENKK